MIPSVGPLEQQALQEFRFQDHISFWNASRAQILDLGGPSLCYYFDFVKWLVSLDLFLLVLVPWWPHHLVRGILTVSACFIFGLGLWVYVYFCRPTESGPGLHVDQTTLSRNFLPPSKLRLTASVFFFCVVIFVYTLVQAQIQNQIGGKVPSIQSISVILAIAHVLFKQAWRFLCFVLTMWESHTSQEAQRRSNLLKLLWYDWLSYFVYFATQASILFPRLPKGTCYATIVREQHLTLLLSDLLLGNFIELAYTWAYNLWFTRNVMQLPGADRSYRIEFDLAEEYAECIFRQFLVIMGCLVSPWPSLLIGIMSHSLEFGVDRFKLLRLSRPPTYSRGDFRHLLATSQICTGLLALGLYPAGLVWLSC